MTHDLSFPTRNALCACGAFSAQAGNLVLVLASEAHLANSLCEILQTNLGTHYLLLPKKETEPPDSFMTGPESAFSLVWIQPVKPQQQLVTQYLKFLNLRQLIVLQAGWLGRMLLPEWKSRPEGDLAVNSQLLWLLSTGVGWSTQDTAFGNLSSLWWGIAARRFQAIHRPDLADRCNARMRHHLHPAAARTSPAYLTIRRAIRETTPAQSA